MELPQPPEPDSGDVVVTLSDCIHLMQADLLLANPTPENLRHRVTDVLMYDPRDEWRSIDNRIILGVGMSCGSVDFDQLLFRAANSDAAAVVVKAHGAPMEQLRSAAVRHSLALLIAPDDADWTRLVALARASVIGVTADSVAGVRLGDLYAFANAAASITSGAASVVDPLGRILGYSTLPGQPIDELRRVTTLALQESLPPALDPDFKTVYAAQHAVYVAPDEAELGRLALAVRAGGELLGTLWIIDPGPERRDAALDALDRMATLAGLHMLHARSASDFGERRNADLLRTLLDDPAHATFAAAQLGFDAGGGLAVAAFSIVRPDLGSLDSVRELQRLLHLVTTVCNLEFNTSHTAMIDSVVCALLPSRGATPRAAHRKVAQEIARYAVTISTHPLVAAVGSIAPQVDGLPTSRTEALETLHYLINRRSAGAARAEPGPTVALFEDYRTPLSLIKVGAFLRESGLAQLDELVAIQALDAEQKTDYLDTLRAYLETNANITAMAERMHVHNNTVRYRVARLTKDFNLDDPATRLWLWLRIATMDLSREGPAAHRAM